MKIQMLSYAKGSDCSKDGVAQPVKIYVKDEIYDVGESLAKAFCEDTKVAKKAPLKKATKKATKKVSE